MKKSVLSCLLALALLLGACPSVAVIAADQTTADGFTYRVAEDGSAALLGYSGTAAALTLPTSLDGHPLTSVKSFCFRNNTTLQSVTVPYSVTTLAPGAFYECTALREVQLDCPIRTISSFTFGRCTALETLLLPSTLSVIEEVSFKDCTVLQTVFFRGKDHRTIAIGDSNDPLMHAVWYDDADRYTSGVWVYAAHGDGTATIVQYEGTDEFVCVPILIGGHAVTTIGNRAFFKNRTMTALNISEGITAIDVCAFAGCTALESVTLPQSLRTIGADAFSNCTALREFSVPDGVTHWPDGLLCNDVSLTTVTMPDSVTSMGSDVFLGCTALRHVTLSDNLAVIGDSAFEACTALETVRWPSQLEEIGVAAFYGCTALTSLTLPDNVAIIKERAFNRCTALQHIDFSDKLLLIETEAFDSCTALRHLELPDWLYILGDGAFGQCTALESVILPRHLDVLRYYTFMGCTSLRRVTLPPELQTIEWGAFAGCDALQDVAIPASVTTVEGYAFLGCPDLKTVRYEGGESDWMSVLVDYRAFHDFVTFEWNAAYGAFPDVPSDAWYATAADHASIRGWIRGFGDGTFGAERPCQRQDVVLMLARIEGADPTASPSETAFSDVKADSYYAAAVSWGVANGVLTGYQNGAFGVGDPITREQLCTVLYRLKGCPTTDNADRTLAAFPDASLVSPFAREAMAWAVDSGLIRGMESGRLAPAVPASRAHIATILLRGM